jgi:hypothetical protein
VPSELDRLRSEVGEVIAKHEAERDLGDFTKYADDPEGFMRDVLRCEPWSMQVKMAEMVRDEPLSIVVSCNSLGKDWCAARIALWWVFARGGLVIVTGPTERQVKQVVMREVRRAFAKAPELPGELFALELRVSADSGILAFTSDNADRLTGFHHPRLLICITEGQGVSDDAYEAARACCTGPDNHLFVYGNPLSPVGPFYRSANSDAWAVLTVPATMHPNVVSGREEIPGAVSREWIQAMKEEYGEDSSIYCARVLAQFPSESIEGLIKRDWLEAAAVRFTAGDFDGAARCEPLVCALDVSRFGGDKTVLTVAQGSVVREITSWQGLSTVETADRTIEVALRAAEAFPQYTAFMQRPLVVVDTIGLGAGVFDILKSRGWMVREFNASNRSSEPERFVNLRAEAYWRFREMLENGRIAFAHNPALNEECSATEWFVTPGGQIQLISKDTIRSTLGRSPDTLDSVVMALATSMGALRKGTISFSTVSI